MKQKELKTSKSTVSTSAGRASSLAAPVLNQKPSKMVKSASTPLDSSGKLFTTSSIHGEAKPAASSLPAKQGVETEENIMRYSLDELTKLEDLTIERPEPRGSVLPSDFWENAKIVYPVDKVPISIRLDTDILEWFKAQGKGYQTMINNVLRSYVDAH